MINELNNDILLQLGKMSATLDAILARLDKINGSVARHEEEIGSLKMSASIEQGIRKGRSSVFESLKPAIYVIAGALALTILENGPKLVQVFSKG